MDDKSHDLINDLLFIYVFGRNQKIMIWILKILKFIFQFIFI
jgi:hypothetical protein